MQEAYETGCLDFGENKVQEIVNKKPQMQEDARFHMIGHLQTNKVGPVSYTHLERCEKALNEKLMELSSLTGQFYKGNLRSGDVLETETSIVVIGDVERGARVLAKGNIIILGALRGAALAGAAGNINAVIVAFEMAPSQIKISDLSYPKAEKGKSLGRGPMMILVENGRICAEPIKKSFLNALNFI